MRSRTALVVLGLTLTLLPSSASGSAPAAYPQPVADVPCAAGALPEAMQGRAPLSDVASGRAAKGYRCNAVEIGHIGVAGGYRVERYVDAAGHECAFADYAAFVGEPVPESGPSTGVNVYDLSNPAKPVQADTLRTAAMQSPHESLRLNGKRGLLVATMSTVATGPGIVDVYDVHLDCRHPVLRASSPLGLLGHESGFAPDGRTYYVASLAAKTLAAIDLTNPSLPRILWISYSYTPHGASVSLDGNRLYLTETTSAGFKGLSILDVSQVQKRVLNPTVTLVSRLTWTSMSAPQNATPFTRAGHRYVMEVDEFGERITGAARIIDVQDEKKPFVASNLRLQVNQPEVYDQLKADPGNSEGSRGYQAHYCTLPSRVDPNIVACSFLMSGLRVFDIRDPRHPRELAYYNAPRTVAGLRRHLGSQAMSAPAYDPTSGDVWYADVNTGLHVIRLIGRAAIPFAGRYVSPGS